MSPTTTRNSLLLSGLLLLAGCDTKGSALYQSLGALNGGPGESGPTSVLETTVTASSEQPSNHLEVSELTGPAPAVEPSDHVDVRVEADPEALPGGFELRLSTDANEELGLPAATALVRLTVSAPDLQPPLVIALTPSDPHSAAIATFSVPIGRDRTLSVAAQDENGKVLARARREGLTVAAGRYGALALGLSTRLGDLFGQVLNGVTLSPEPGVTVTLGDTRAITDPHGVYRLEGLASGAQVIGFEKASFEGATRSFEVKEGPQTAPETVRLSPR